MSSLRDSSDQPANPGAIYTVVSIKLHVAFSRHKVKCTTISMLLAELHNKSKGVAWVSLNKAALGPDIRAQALKGQSWVSTDYNISHMILDNPNTTPPNRTKGAVYIVAQQNAVFVWLTMQSRPEALETHPEYLKILIDHRAL